MPTLHCDNAGEGAKAVAKRKLQQAKLPFNKPPQDQGAEAQAEVSGSNEPEAASPLVLPKVHSICSKGYIQLNVSACGWPLG